MIDFHSHILPGIDDGSASPEMSIEMLRMEAQQGVTCVVATPHFYPQYDNAEQFLLKRSQAEQMLRSEMEKHTDLPQVIVGAEVAYFRGISEAESLPLLTINDSNCILIEMPPAPWSKVFYEELEAIWTKRGIVPIVAHIDRYIAPLATCGIPRTLAQMPVLVQANASFFTEWFTASMAMRMLKADQIHLLGSDCHNTTVRKPDLGAALARIEEKMGSDALARIDRYANNLLHIWP